LSLKVDIFTRLLSGFYPKGSRGFGAVQPDFFLESKWHGRLN
jgi:hypothetical protein